MPLNPDSLNVLEKVKRGTPARFVLLSKGVRVLNLVVYRKGTLESAKKDAKEAGAGELSFGVVDGQGANLSFKLARADGFEKSPVKDLTLKVFLGESQFDCKPTIEIVDALPDVVMDDGGPPQMPQRTAPLPPTPQQRPPIPPQRPPQPPLQPPPQRQGNVYRTQGEWDVLLAKIGEVTDQDTKTRLLTQAVNDLKAERAQVQTDPLLLGDPNAMREQNGLHMTVAEELKSLHSRPLPQQQGPPRRQLPPQPPPRHLNPQGRVGVPQKSQEDRDRETLVADAQRRTQAITGVESPYNRFKLRKILEECETDANSDFGKVAQGMLFHPGESFETIQKRFQDAELAAQKYIKDHPDPKIGKLPSRVLLRIQNCKIFMQQTKALLEQLQAEEDAAQAMVQTYQALLDRGQPIPYGVADQIYQVLERAKLSAAAQAALRRIADTIRDADQPRGYDKLAQLQNPTELEKAGILLSHGCFKGGGGGTSDVRLLRNPDRSVAFAFKGAKGEAIGALDMLKLPPGASATREDLCSTLSQNILSQTGIDFGFPKAQAINLAGQTGALIQGIQGLTVDPEEISKANGQDPPDTELINELERRLREIPEKLTAQSLQKVVLFSTLSCQWDCKWGNLMVEGETNARPIDGGGAFPTQECVDSFGRDRTVKPLAIMALTEYPRHLSLGNKVGQTLPRANDPMDPQLVQALLKLDVTDLLGKLKTRRDEIARNVPDLAPPPHNGGLVDDATLDRVAASIQATKDILRANPQQSLVQFATAYENWWIGWITENRRGFK